MNRSKFSEYVLVDAHGGIESHSAMHDAMPNGSDPLSAVDPRWLLTLRGWTR